MKNTSSISGEIDEYIGAASPIAQPILREVRRLVHEVAPEATECISYRMPAFRDKRVFFYFAAFKAHLGIYPPVSGDGDLERELAPYRGPKGNLKFTFDKPIPYDLIARVIRALHTQYG